MKEIYRDDNLLAVELPEQTRTFGFISAGRKHRIRLSMPESLVIVGLAGMGVAYRKDDGYATPKFCGVNPLFGYVCLGDGLRRPSSLDEALPYYLDQYYQRPFDEFPLPEPDDLLNGTSYDSDHYLFGAAYGLGIDARPYREHRYFNPSEKLLCEEMRTEHEFIAFPKYGKKCFGVVFDSYRHVVQAIQR